MCENCVLGAPGLPKSGPGGSRGGPGGSRGGPGEVPAPGGCPGGALRSAGHRFWAPPGGHFGYHFGSIFGVFSYTFLIEFLYHFLMPFWTLLGTILEPFWRRFRGQISSWKVLRFRARPVEPPGTTTGQKNWIFIGRLFKIEGRPFRVGVLTGAVLEAKMEPK